MQIIRIDRKGNAMGDTIFSSFHEVFDYCLEDLRKMTQCLDGIVYGFKILDTNERFTTFGTPKGEDSEICLQPCFRQ